MSSKVRRILKSRPWPSTPPKRQYSTERQTPRKKRKHPGHTKLSPALERIITDVPEANRACKRCGTTVTAITPVEHVRVEHVPERLVVHVERREVLVCGNSH
jgi:hypothetical protein